MPYTIKRKHPDTGEEQELEVQTLGDKQAMTELSIALAPLALAEHDGLGQTIERVFKGTVLQPVLDNIQKRGVNQLTTARSDGSD